MASADLSHADRDTLAKKLGGISSFEIDRARPGSVQGNQYLEAGYANLVQNPEFARGLLENSTDCLKVLDLDGNLQFVSPGGLCALEIDDFSDFAGSAWIDFWDQPHKEKARAAVQIAKAGGVGEFHGPARTAKGTLRWWDVLVSPIFDPDGRVAALLSISRDVSPLKVANEQQNAMLGLAAQREATLRLFLDAAHGGFYCVDREGTTTLCNAGFLKMLGFAGEEEAIGKKLHSVIHHTHPDGAHYPKEECPIYQCASTGTPAHVEDELFFRLDGTPVPVEYWVRPILQEGVPNGAVCTFMDISERKSAQAQQELLTNELTHRIKNTLSMVQAIVSQTLRTAATPMDAGQSIGQRLSALGHAHEMLTGSNWEGAGILALVERVVAPHQPSPPRIRASGPDIELNATAALTLAMALHELCTNATKYGALSNGDGWVDLRWEIEIASETAFLNLKWQERGGPPVSAPTTKGFGSRLIDTSFGSEPGAMTELNYDPAGVIWVLKAPIAGINK